MLGRRQQQPFRQTVAAAPALPAIPKSRNRPGMLVLLLLLRDSLARRGAKAAFDNGNGAKRQSAAEEKRELRHVPLRATEKRVQLAKQDRSEHTGKPLDRLQHPEGKSLLGGTHVLGDQRGAGRGGHE